jgi:hypothetical protein
MKNTVLAFFFLLILTGCNKSKEIYTITFKSNDHEQKWAIKELNRSLVSDWTYSGFLTFEMKASTTQWFNINLYDSTGVRRVSIHPMQGPWIRASVPLIHFMTRNTKGMDMAAISKTARPGYWIGFTNAVGDISKVDSIGFSMRIPTGNPTIELRNFKLTEKAQDTIFGPVPLIDEFGQWIPAEWPGKAHSVEELKTAWAEEEKALTLPENNISEYGGFKNHKTKASGFFRVEKIDGKWWFVDPDGCLFYSAGSTCIGPRSDFARIEGREYIFKEFPPAGPESVSKEDTSSKKVSTSRTNNYSFFVWNLKRRFGEEWYGKWVDFTVRRMKNWGLNTVANWSDERLGELGKVPYVVTLRGWGIETGIMGMPDVYDPQWKASVDKAAEQQCLHRKSDKYILGYFIGNEPPWPHREQELVNEILKGNDSALKNELKKFLEGGDTQERRKEFIYQTYSLFINTINSAVKKYDPNHLNLGLRFGGSAPDEIIRASKDFDVFSFNSYGYAVNQDIIKRVTEITGQPMIIGEFHFGVPERGLGQGLVQTVNQEERAVAYRYYVENAAANPSIIGTHWFQWIDQPATGRYDGENYNIGFVDVTDRPYPELVDASKQIFIRLYGIHSGEELPVTREAKRQ